MLTRRAALVMRLHASVFFFLAIALIVRPLSIGQFLGFKDGVLTPELLWSFRLLGAFLLLPALLGPIVAAFAGERGLRQSSSGMAVLSIVAGVITLIAPLGLTSGKIGSAAAWFAFALLYLYALRGRGRNR